VPKRLLPPPVPSRAQGISCLALPARGEGQQTAQALFALHQLLSDQNMHIQVRPLHLPGGRQAPAALHAQSRREPRAA
jgi:hypothetical protein